MKAPNITIYPFKYSLVRLTNISSFKRYPKKKKHFIFILLYAKISSGQQDKKFAPFINIYSFLNHPLNYRLEKKNSNSNSVKLNNQNVLISYANEWYGCGL